MAGTFYDGSKAVTTAGTRVPLKSTRTMANWIWIQPTATNTDVIYIGGATVSSTSGNVMGTGDSGVLWPLAGFEAYDLSTIYIDAAVSGEGVQFVYTSL